MTGAPGEAPSASAGASTPVPPASATTRFAHNSERQFAKLLDFYGIEWEYEPRTFTLERDQEGRPVQAFTPDFYLPAYDLFIEITTLNQKLVTKKNRKARRLQELHPDLRVKVLYQRDYLHLLAKYGLEPPSQLAGQLASHRAWKGGPELDLGLGPSAAAEPEHADAADAEHADDRAEADAG